MEWHIVISPAEKLILFSALLVVFSSLSVYASGLQSVDIEYPALLNGLSQQNYRTDTIGTTLIIPSKLSHALVDGEIKVSVNNTNQSYKYREQIILGSENYITYSEANTPAGHGLYYYAPTTNAMAGIDYQIDFTQSGPGLPTNAKYQTIPVINILGTEYAIDVNDLGLSPPEFSLHAGKKVTLLVGQSYMDDRGYTVEVYSVGTTGWNVSRANINATAPLGESLIVGLNALEDNYSSWSFFDDSLSVYIEEICIGCYVEGNFTSSYVTAWIGEGKLQLKQGASFPLDDRWIVRAINYSTGYNYLQMVDLKYGNTGLSDPIEIGNFFGDELTGLKQGVVIDGPYNKDGVELWELELTGFGGATKIDTTEMNVTAVGDDNAGTDVLNMEWTDVGGYHNEFKPSTKGHVAKIQKGTGLGNVTFTTGTHPGPWFFINNYSVYFAGVINTTNGYAAQFYFGGFPNGQLVTTTYNTTSPNTLTGSNVTLEYVDVVGTTICQVNMTSMYSGNIIGGGNETGWCDVWPNNIEIGFLIKMGPERPWMDATNITDGTIGGDGGTTTKLNRPLLKIHDVATYNNGIVYEQGMAVVFDSSTINDYTGSNVSVGATPTGLLVFNTTQGAHRDFNYSGNGTYVNTAVLAPPSENDLHGVTPIGTLIDAVGAEGSRKLTFKFPEAPRNSTVTITEVDKIPPKVTISLPQPVYHNSSEVPWDVSAEDLVSLIEEQIYYVLDGGNSTPMCSNCSGVWGSFLGLEEGKHTFVVYATDMQNNTGSSKVTFFVDTTTPEIIQIYPENGSSYRDIMWASVLYNESNPDKVKVYWKEKNAVNYTERPIWCTYVKDELHHCSADLNLSAYAHGTNISFYFEVSDEAGNTAESDVHTIFVDLMPPEISDFKAVPNAYVNPTNPTNISAKLVDDGPIPADMLLIYDNEGLVLRGYFDGYDSPAMGPGIESSKNYSEVWDATENMISGNDTGSQHATTIGGEFFADLNGTIVKIIRVYGLFKYNESTNETEAWALFYENGTFIDLSRKTAGPEDEIEEGNSTFTPCLMNYSWILEKPATPSIGKRGTPIVLEKNASNLKLLKDVRVEDGTYSALLIAVDNVGNQNNATVEINVSDKLSPVLNLSASPAWTVYAGTGTTVNCTADTNKVALKLYRNGVEVSNPDVAVLGVGYYTYVCNSTETGSHLPAEVTNVLTVKTNPPQPPAPTGGGGGRTPPGSSLPPVTVKEVILEAVVNENGTINVTVTNNLTSVLFLDVLGEEVSAYTHFDMYGNISDEMMLFRESKNLTMVFTPANYAKPGTYKIKLLAKQRGDVLAEKDINLTIAEEPWPQDRVSARHYVELSSNKTKVYIVAYNPLSEAQTVELKDKVPSTLAETAKEVTFSFSPATLDEQTVKWSFDLNPKSRKEIVYTADKRPTTLEFGSIEVGSNTKPGAIAGMAAVGFNAETITAIIAAAVVCLAIIGFLIYSHRP